MRISTVFQGLRVSYTDWLLCCLGTTVLKSVLKFSVLLKE